jgi:hypothetical protein
MRRPLFACVAACLAPAAPGHAADAPLLPLASPNSFQESYSPTGTRSFQRASGRAIVGLQIGRGAGRFRLDDISIDEPAGASAKALCVKLTSKDARYWSLNAYRGPDGKAAIARLETKSKFADDLAQRYRADDFASRAIAAADCTEDTDGPLLAVTPPGAIARDVLVVHVNAVGARAAVKLTDKAGKALATAACAQAPRDSTIAFTEICEIPLAGLRISGAARLQTTLAGPDAGPSPIVTDIYLPAP